MDVLFYLLWPLFVFTYLVSPITMDAVDLALQSGGMSNLVDHSLTIIVNKIFFLRIDNYSGPSV